MPYGVSDELWNMLPADDQEAVIASYEAAQASQPSTGYLPDAGGIPQAGIAYPDGGAPAPAIDTSGPVAPAIVPGVDFSGPERELAAFEQANVNEPGQADVRLPSQAWGATRDYIVSDQPFLGAHIRRQGATLRGVVASDLWSRST